MELPFPEFLALAYRLPLYEGTIAARVAEQERSERRNAPPGARMVPDDRETLTTNREFAGIVSFN
jgi:hypothetical protein